jgi:hypothetical protein
VLVGDEVLGGEVELDLLADLYGIISLGEVLELGVVLFARLEAVAAATATAAAATTATTGAVVAAVVGAVSGALVARVGLEVEDLLARVGSCAVSQSGGARRK